MSSPVQFVDTRQFHKYNYSDAVKYAIPSMYFEEDYALNDNKLDILDQVINSHLNIIQNISSVINVSAIQGTVYSSINNKNGISQFFVKQNNLTNLDINDFEKKLLIPLNKSFRDFNSSSDFSDYLTETLLPGIVLNKPTLDFLGGGSPSANHNYLITNLSWLYFLNTSGPTYDASTYVHNILVNNIYNAKPILLNDGIRGLVEYIWRNYSSRADWRNYKLIPDDLRPPIYTVDNLYTSGTQQLDRLLTLVDIVYSPLYIDNGDLRVKNAIDDFLQNSYLLSKKYPQGPFLKLVKAFSFAFADYSNKIDKLETLADLDYCPDEYLPLLADLIGWKLFGSEPDRWRLQLANAVDIYKSVGTKKSIQFVANSIFGEDVFNASSTIYELWESYVPFLIYYSLATESPVLKSFNTWTEPAANLLGVSGYNASSMDTNIRLCVDKIIYDLVTDFSSSFILGNKPFEVSSSGFIFNYRDREFKVPPFEEIPYYLHVNMDNRMIDSIVDKLICFSVPIDYAEAVGNYIRQKTILATDDYSLKNSWLMFTSACEYPPNWAEVIEDLSNNKLEYLPLWSGKSSHFKVLLDVSGFDFSKDSLETDSRETLKIVSQTIRDFSPAKTVPDVIARASVDDNYDLSNVHFQYIGLDKTEQAQTMFTNTNVSALVMSTYKRGLTPTSIATFSRDGVDSIADTLRSANGTAAKLPRRSHRRRNFKFTLPRDGYFDKTGFNMPTPFNSYSNNGVFLPLGLIPSSQQFVPIPDYHNIPAIYSRCENLSSSSVYSGLVVSNTYPVRGWRGIQSNAKVRENGVSADYYMDYNQLHPFMYTIHYIKEKAKIYEASAYYYNNLSALAAVSVWKNVLGSYANSSTAYSGNFPASFDDYVNFGLGRDFHKFYYDYTHNFARHRAIPNVLNLDGPTIFGHTFGSIIKNSKFTENGDFSKTNPQLITSSLLNIVEFKNNTGIFSSSGTASGMYIASTVANLPIDGREYRSSGLLNHIELCQTSGANSENSFTIFRIDRSNKAGSRYNSLLHENTLIRQKAVQSGFGRMIFDISKYQTTTAEGYDIATNFLTPEHKFKLSLNTLISDVDGLNFGGGTIGVWIHTKPENGSIWSYTKDKVWIQHSASSITKSDVIQSYSHLFGFNETSRDLSSRRLRCSRFLDITNPYRGNDVFASLSESDFNKIELEFDTENLPISVPNSYFEFVSQKLHRLNQNYVIEIFTIPSQNNKFTLYYGLNLTDMTLNKWSKPLVGGISNGSNMGDIYCKEFRVDLSREQILTIIKYLNSINGAYSNFGYANRVANYTSGVYEVSGGSRINYAETADWSNVNYTVATKLIQLNILKN